MTKLLCRLALSMSKFNGLWVLLVLCVFCAPMRADEADFFEKKIRPLFAEHCYACHADGAKTIHASLLLDSVESIRLGGDSGPIVQPGDPDASLIYQSLVDAKGLQMPPEGRLPEQQIQDVRSWIARGAVMPSEETAREMIKGEFDYESSRQFWSFQPLEMAPLPEVHGAEWPEQRLDYFLLRGMEAAGLSPSPKADRRTLLRRTYLTLTGLPPTESQASHFLNDSHPLAFERMVDRLMASPEYGQHWARWWLDLARYTDRTASWLSQEGQAFYYRDWVADALNEDVPYDDFVRRQLATDQMVKTTAKDLSALGFLSLSPTYWKELKLPCEIIKVIVADEWEERVDVVSRTFLGLTAACARCHDHKFDPVSMEDYYALAGVFASTRSVAKPLIEDAMYQPVETAKKKVAELLSDVEKLKKETKEIQSKESGDGGAKATDLEMQIAAMLREVEAIKRETPYYDAPLVNALTDESLYVVRAGATPQDGSRLEYRPESRDLPLFMRGNPNRPAEMIPRRFLQLFGNERPFEKGSGRLELADAIFSDAKDLAARVIVNRVWLAFFGRGIVDTPSNFGVQGSPPTHPELIDDLAFRFIQQGWSLKRLHREIVLSSTWQQSSLATDLALSKDPNNQWWARMDVRKLTFEQWRDSMLLGADSLRSEIGGEASSLEDPRNYRRTLYSTIHRRDMSTTMMIHDFPDPTQHSPKRIGTLTPLQGLYALNGPLMLRQSSELLERLKRQEMMSVEDSVKKVYGWLYFREPTQDELRLSMQFLGKATSSVTDQRWQQYLHVLLASNELQFLD